MNSAGKLQVAMELYNSGMLCKCSNWIEIEDEWLDESEKVLQHESECEGREKFKQLINGEIK